MKERTIYDNGLHRLSVCRNENTRQLCLKVETDYHKASGRVQWPIRYDDGRIGYDRPEVVPCYLREIVWSIYNNRSRKYTGIDDYRDIL